MRKKNNDESKQIFWTVLDNLFAGAMFSFVTNKQTIEEIREALSVLAFDPEISVFISDGSGAPLIGLLKKLGQPAAKFETLKELIKNTILFATVTESILKRAEQKKERNKELLRYARQLLAKYFPQDLIAERAEGFSDELHEICDSIKELRSVDEEVKEEAKKTLLMSLRRGQARPQGSVEESKKRKKCEESTEPERMSSEVKETITMNTPKTFYQGSPSTVTPPLIMIPVSPHSPPLLKQNTCCACKRPIEAIEYRLRGGSFCCSQCFEKETILSSLFNQSWEASSTICKVGSESVGFTRLRCGCDMDSTSTKKHGTFKSKGQPVQEIVWHTGCKILQLPTDAVSIRILYTVY